MYTRVSKCKNDKMRERERQNKEKKERKKRKERKSITNTLKS
jgi:hypothetical protein